jgi:peptidoglycan/xylan/chitin deacetylase (PgdA/CDA1 family)
MSYGAYLRRLAAPLFRPSLSQHAALRLVARRDRSLVLLYHRILPDGTAPDAIVPSLQRQLFVRQLEALLRVGNIVPLRQLLEPSRQSQRPRIALTFDDDHAGYVGTVVPELQALGVPATFFLSGRSLHGLPPYWWTSVEQSLRIHGLDYTRRALGVSGETVAHLAVALERSPCAAELVSRLPPVDEAQPTAADIRAMARAGMTIGFHTLHHPVLSNLAGRDLELALTDGRRELAAAAGTEVDLLAYPHGLATTAVAEAAERAGYAAAFATGGRPISATSDRFLLDRWEPGALDADELGAQAAMRLMRSPTRPRAMRRGCAVRIEAATIVND